MKIGGTGTVPPNPPSLLALLEHTCLDETAPAKINLTLRVTGRRADGYHLLDSLVVFAGAHDRLTATPADDLTLSLSGPFAPGLGAEPHNLVLRAARALAAATGTGAGAQMHLEKHLPVASGIGGGSSDAAATLRLLSRLWSVPIPAALAATLGADVPVCLDPIPRRMTGIGDILHPAPALPPCGVALINPGQPVSTQAVFGARTAPFSRIATLPKSWPSLAAMAADLVHLPNDLEIPALTLCPAIGEILSALRGLPTCRLARMSGSGATCFALFDTPEEAATGVGTLARLGWWTWSGTLYARSDPT